MGLLDSFRYRISAALSPQQMIKQKSKPVIKEKGWSIRDELDFEIYNDMLKDAQIKAGYELIRNFLLSRRLIVTPGDDSPEAQEIANAFEVVIEDMDYPMRKVRNDMYSAIVYGFSVGEVVWKKEEDSENIGIKRIRPIPTATLVDPFEYDDNGDVKYIVQQDPDGGDDIKIEPEKCIVYTYDEQFGDKEGLSILDSVYENWRYKQDLQDWWTNYLQKHEGPTLAAYIENPTLKMEAQDMLEEIHEGRTNITLGQNDRLEVIESNHRGEGFKEAIQYHDTMIFRKMNIGTLILGQDNGSGAYAQSKTQYDTLSVFLDGVHADIAAELQVVLKKWVDMHYNNVEKYPKVTFESFEEEDLIELVNALKPLIDVMAIDPRDKWFKTVVSKVVQKYTDVDMDGYLEEDKEQTEEQMVQQPEVVPTAMEMQTPPSTEQVQAIEDITKTIPPRK